jgi:hypothetical protein
LSLHSRRLIIRNAYIQVYTAKLSISLSIRLITPLVSRAITADWRAGKTMMLFNLSTTFAVGCYTNTGPGVVKFVRLGKTRVRFAASTPNHVASAAPY